MEITKYNSEVNKVLNTIEDPVQKEILMKALDQNAPKELAFLSDSSLSKQEKKSKMELCNAIESLVYNISVEKTTARPEAVRKHFLDHLKTSFLSDKYKGVIDENDLNIVFERGLERADKNRHRQTEQDKLTILKKNAASIVYARSALSDENRDIFIEVVEEMPKIPNSELVQSKNQSDEDYKKAVDARNTEWEQAVEKGEEMAEKRIASSKKSSEKQKEKKRQEREQKKRARNDEEGDVDTRESDQDNSQSSPKNRKKESDDEE